MHLCRMSNNNVYFSAMVYRRSANKRRTKKDNLFCSGVDKKSSTITVKMSSMGLIIQQPASVLSRNGLSTRGLDQHTCIVFLFSGGGDLGGRDGGPATARDGAIGDWDKDRRLQTCFQQCYIFICQQRRKVPSLSWKFV